MSFKLYLKLISQSLQQVFIYRTTTVLIILFGLLFFTGELVAGLVYFSFSDKLLSWTRDEYLLLVSSATTMNYLYQTLFIASHEELSEKIVEGELDYTLIRPVNSFLFYNLYRFDFPSLINLIVSIIIQIYLLRNFNINLGISLMYIFLVIAGMYMLFLLNQIIITLSFWTEKSEKLMAIPEYLFDFSARPKNIYPSFIRTILLFVIPILLATNSPTLLIKGELNIFYVVFLILVDLVLTVFALKLWNKGIFKYSSTN